MKPIYYKWKRNIVYGLLIFVVAVYLGGPQGMVLGGLCHSGMYVVDKNFL